MRKTRKSLLVAMCALVLALGVNATLAWLTDTTQEVENTFTVGNIDITLTESDADIDGNSNSNEYKMVPGNVIAKDPIVTVLGGSEKCYLFVKVTEQNNPLITNEAGKYIVWSAGAGWTQVDGETAVYYRMVDESNVDQPFAVLAASDDYENGYVTVNENITKDMMDEIAEDEEPMLTFQACAVQQDNLTLEQAWEQAEAAMSAN